MSITRTIAVPVTCALLLAGAACGSPQAASPPEAPSVPSTTSRAGEVRPTTTTTAATPPAATIDIDLSDVDRSLDALEREIQDLDEGLSQTQEGDIDQ